MDRDEVLASVRDVLERHGIEFEDEAVGELEERVRRAEALQVYVLGSEETQEVGTEEAVRLAHENAELLIRGITAHGGQLPLSKHDFEAVLLSVCPLWPFC